MDCGESMNRQYVSQLGCKKPGAEPAIGGEDRPRRGTRIGYYIKSSRELGTGAHELIKSIIIGKSPISFGHS
jgi:hypothetical protein